MKGNGLPPQSGTDPVVLILGSYPGPRSLDTGEYYANSRNQFWQIMDLLLHIETSLPYRDRVLQLNEKGVALWDTICSCERHGGLDSAIRDAVCNEIPEFLKLHPGIRLIVANGSTAGRCLVRSLGREAANSGIPVCILPSTSPANTRYSLVQKLEKWRIICDYLS